LGEPFVQFLLHSLHELNNKVDSLTQELREAKDEISKLKGTPKRPKITASNIDNPLPEEEGTQNKSEKSSRNTGKQKKKENLEIHDRVKIENAELFCGWKRYGVEKRIIQDIDFKPFNTEYELQRWISPGGEVRTAELPAHLQGTHFGPTLKTYVIHQYYACGVTQPLIRAALQEIGVEISTGQIDAILNNNNEAFHEEKEALLTVAKTTSKELRVDDTGAHHKFKNGFTTCINSDLFTYFKTTDSKSRINFLEILRGNDTRYYINEEGFLYLEDVAPNLKKYIKILQRSYEEGGIVFEDEASVNAYLSDNRIKATYAIRYIKEAMLIGTLIEQGFDPKTIIHSDGARQFSLFVHSLCSEYLTSLRKTGLYSR
jgi:hypothetical protein